MTSEGYKKHIPKVVVFGGGSGTYEVLSGLKKYPVNISAVISMCDSGGSTGRLRKELGILPPGDIRRAIIALSDIPFAEKTLTELFNFRFESGDSLKGHSVGNILIAALAQITGSVDEAISEAARILHSTGNVYPVTLDNTNLVALLTDGTRVYGETNIDRRTVKPHLPIDKIFLTPKAKIYKKAKEAIIDSDLIVFAPGDLFTSLLPVLLVDGVLGAIKRSEAEILYVVNLMTKKGETDNFKASDFVGEVEKYLGEIKTKLKYVVVNKKKKDIKGKISLWYKKYGSIPVLNDLVKKESTFKIIEKDFYSESTFFRHDSKLLASEIVKVLK